MGQNVDGSCLKEYIGDGENYNKEKVRKRGSMQKSNPEVPS